MEVQLAPSNYSAAGQLLAAARMVLRELNCRKFRPMSTYKKELCPAVQGYDDGGRPARTSQVAQRTRICHSGPRFTTRRVTSRHINDFHDKKNDFSPARMTTDRTQLVEEII